MRSIIVLGMHRSATSMVARSLHASGEVCMGKKLLLNLPDNPKGHYEDKLFLQLNKAILKAAGGNWMSPPKRDNIILTMPLFGDRIRSAVAAAVKHAEQGGYRSWGFKDPRTTLTIDLYLPFIKNPQFVCCVRDSQAIAQSLNKRNGISIVQGVKLAEIYNRRMLAFLAEQTLGQS